MEVAREMVRTAKLAGADAIKFQHHLPDEEMLQEGVPISANMTMPLYEFLKMNALTLNQHEELTKYCDEVGIGYLCTPFSRRAAEELNELGVKAFKIGSGELSDLPTLKVIASFGRPMILSTGMASWEEITETVETLKPLNDQIALLNCTSAYPTQHADVQLDLIGEMKRRYGIVTGHSDHTPDIHTCIAAAALGASIIEKHYILDRRQPGPDQAVSIEPSELAELVRAIRRVEAARGAEKIVRPDERAIREWAHRSVVSLVAIPKGTIIEASMVWTKRPGTGIPARYLERVMGREALEDIGKDQLIRWHQLNGPAP
jgi:N-acetylneuraminate synthase